MTNWSEIASKEFIPGFNGRMLHTDGCTISQWEIRQGAVLPEHNHIHEQVSHVLEGQFEMTVDGNTQVLSKDDIIVIPSNAVHSGRALTPCRIMDIFTPRRDDYA